MLKDETLKAWRDSCAKPTRPKLPPLPKQPDSLQIVALMSCPRLGWTDTFGCVQEIFQPLGIHVAKHTGAFWGQGLTHLLTQAVELEMDYAITIDYDTVFVRDDVIRLIKVMESDPSLDCVVSVQVRREANTSMFTMKDADGKVRTEILAEEFMVPLTPIVTGHFGLTIIRIKSLAKLPKPWFCAVPSENGEWYPEDGHIDEDVYFWLNAQENGWKVCLANEVRVGHIQTLVSWPSEDFSPRFQYISEWNRKT